MCDGIATRYEYSLYDPLKKIFFLFLLIENPRCHYKALTFVPIAKIFFKYS